MEKAAASTIGWVDFSDAEREKVNQAIKAFRQQDTIDELGIGQVRDAFADLLFPGTTTIQTRLRYMLFVPWLCLTLEDQRVDSKDFRARLKEDEVRLINGLKAGCPEGEDGLIGSSSGASLQRFPSEIYWSGIRTWGIRWFPGSLRDYVRHIDSYYRRVKAISRADDGDPLDIITPNWHPALPEIPVNMLEKESLNLTTEEADYLVEMVRKNCPESLLSHLFVHQRDERADVEFIWQHLHKDSFPSKLDVQIRHARNFSEIMHGAHLLYNLLLCRLTERQVKEDEYFQRMNEWWKMIHSESNRFNSRPRDTFWRLARQGAGRPINHGTKHFIDTWIDFTLKSDSLEDLLRVASNQRLLEKREHSIKGRRARLTTPQRREDWRPGSGEARLSFRWEIVRTYLADLKHAYSGDKGNA